jgi:hypothetical protein
MFPGAGSADRMHTQLGTVQSSLCDTNVEDIGRSTVFTTPSDVSRLFICSCVSLIAPPVFITLLVCRAMGKLLSYMKQPPVMGEILGGIILGPSVLGQSQAYMQHIWPQNTVVKSVDTFGVVANVGLIFFMFISQSKHCV